MKGFVGAAVLALSGVAVASPATAEVGTRQGGFTVSNTAEIAAPPERVWAALGRPGAWWSDSHTWSGSASNMTLEARAGGCFCERLADGGSVMHGQVLLAQPNRTLRLAAALGPLQELGASGALTWMITAEGSGSRVVFTYSVGGLPDGLAGQLAPAVDGVLRQQLERMERYVETGRAGA